MIQQETILRVSDNSGAKTVKCIKVLGGFKRKYAFVGDTIVVSIQNLRNRSKLTSKVKKGEIYNALIIKTKNMFKKKDGYKISSNKNAVVLFNKRGNPVATRMFAPMPYIIKKKKKKKNRKISENLLICL